MKLKNFETQQKKNQVSHDQSLSGNESFYDNIDFENLENFGNLENFAKRIHIGDSVLNRSTRHQPSNLSTQLTSILCLFGITIS